MEGCSNKCVPNRTPAHEAIDALLQLKSISALKCTVVAGMVKQFAGGVFGNSRKVLSSDSSSKVRHISR